MNGGAAYVRTFLPSVNKMFETLCYLLGSRRNCTSSTGSSTAASSATRPTTRSPSRAARRLALLSDGYRLVAPKRLIRLL
jgi:hypothetical protein